MRWSGRQISDIRSQIGELPDEKKERFMKKYGLSDYDATQLTETRQRAEFFEEVAKEGTPKAIANILINKKVTTKEELMKFLQNAPSISADELQETVERILKENPKAIEDYRNGKEQALMFLVGQALRQLKGKGDAQGISAIIRRLIV